MGITKQERTVIKVKRNGLGDSRTAGHMPTFQEFQEANDSHIQDVSNVMELFADMILNAGSQHDWTKKKYEGDFYRDMCLAIQDPDFNFEEAPWYQMHIATERHHITKHCKDDINLVDILEHLVDCVCAGKARNSTGKVYPVKIDDDILRKAVANTVKLLEYCVIVED